MKCLTCLILTVQFAAGTLPTDRHPEVTNNTTVTANTTAILPLVDKIQPNRNVDMIATDEFDRNENLDESWTSRVPNEKASLQVPSKSQLATRPSTAAEGTGLEPATPCGARHFQCRR